MPNLSQQRSPRSHAVIHDGKFQALQICDRTASNRSPANSFASCPDTPSLISLVLTCKASDQCLRGAEKLIAMDVLRNEVGEEALYAGIMTLGAAKMKCNKTKHVRYFITKYITSPTNYNHNLSLSDALLLSRLDKHVTFFAQAFATLAASLIPTTNDFARACSPSRTELGRIKRSFYFFEMYYNLFRLTRVIAPDKRMLFRHFSSWEKEQLATVRNYLLHAIAPCKSIPYFL